MYLTKYIPHKPALSDICLYVDWVHDQRKNHVTNGKIDKEKKGRSMQCLTQPNDGKDK